MKTGRVSILGVGLLGGSLGLALRRNRPGIEVVGLDEPDVLGRALSRGAIHRAATSVEDAVSSADVVVLAAPIAENHILLRAAAPHLGREAVVTDVGSVKVPIVREAGSALADGALFVGGHPMTGSERRGVANADPLLFENAAYVLCPPAGPPDPRYAELVDLVEAVGARVIEMDPARHDRCVAAVSHLPQLVAISLVNQLAPVQEDVPTLLAAGGFRDMTRIASSPFSVWRDILEANREEILGALDRFEATFEALRERVAAGDPDGIAAAFAGAAAVRESVPAGTKGFLEPLCDVYVYTPDQPGALQRITGAVAEGGVSIKDIELLKIREGTGGTFRLGLSDDSSADRTVRLLGEAGFQAYRL